MKTQMPQEIEVWYVLPAIRREIAKIMIDKYGLKQRESAKILGITESAISQYLHEKRAAEVIFDKKTMQLIINSTRKIMKNHNELTRELYKLSDFIKRSELLCQIHRRYDANISKSCDICLQGGIEERPDNFSISTQLIK